MKKLLLLSLLVLSTMCFSQTIDTVESKVFFYSDSCCYTSPILVKNVPLMTEGTTDMLFYMDVKTKTWFPSRSFIYVRDERVPIIHPF